MLIRRLMAAGLALVLGGGLAAAQTPATDPAPTPAPRHRRAHTAPVTPATTPAATTPAADPAPVPAATPVTPAARTQRVTIPPGTKVNLNTASASELDALPSVGKARLKVIMTERAKGSYKDWSDFETRMKHTSVNAGVRAKIKDMVTF